MLQPQECVNLRGRNDATLWLTRYLVDMTTQSQALEPLLRQRLPAAFLPSFRSYHAHLL